MVLLEEEIALPSSYKKKVEFIRKSALSLNLT